MQGWLCLGANSFFILSVDGDILLLSCAGTQSLFHNILCSLFCGKLKTQGGRLRNYWDLFTELRYVCVFFFFVWQEAAWAVTDECIQVMGGMGFMKVSVEHNLLHADDWEADSSSL